MLMRKFVFLILYLLSEFDKKITSDLINNPLTIDGLSTVKSTTTFY